MDDLEKLEGWAASVLRQLEPGARRALARRVATDLRRSQQRRIMEQRNPDGSPFEPRRNLRERRGRIRRAAMFVKMRQSRYLRVAASPRDAAVYFTGRVARIARVHQEGAVDAVEPGGPRVRYDRRELLGFTRADVQHIRELIIQHLAR